MAKTVTKNAEISKAYGNDLPKPLPFSYSFEELQKGDEIPADEQPDAEDIRNLVNSKRNAKARAAASNQALTEAGVQKPTLESPEFRLASMVKVLVAAGKSEAEATELAKTVLGM
jgi:hypothetical protein